MRLWTLHPKYLDAKGLVALWREGLLARAVLRGETRGYKNHPQLDRFKAHPNPPHAIDAYLHSVHTEAIERGYTFDLTKIGELRSTEPIAATTGQLDFEWQHLLGKLSSRSPANYERWRRLSVCEAHPLFRIHDGPVESWERV